MQAAAHLGLAVLLAGLAITGVTEPLAAQAIPRGVPGPLAAPTSASEEAEDAVDASVADHPPAARPQGSSQSAPLPAGTPLDYLPVLAGGYLRLDSEVLGRPLHVYVRLPEGYDPDTLQTYPAVYLLDGDSLFPVLATHHLFLSYDIGLPEAIVVGIAYGSLDPGLNKRGYDFTPPSAEPNPERGGADAFHRFLTSELVPWIERTYRADPHRRILFGQSRGGSLVLYSAFRHPDVFWGRIASNPTFDPGREIFFSPAVEAHREDLGLLITSGSDDLPHLREAALAWKEAWRDATETEWRHEVLTIPGGTHSAHSSTSYALGMQWLFCRNPSATPFPFCQPAASPSVAVPPPDH